MLRITSHESADTVCLKLEGMVKGAWVPEMERCWRQAYSTRNKAPIVDLSDVVFVDAAGKYLFALMHAHGTKFIAGTPMMIDLVNEITSGFVPAS